MQTEALVLPPGSPLDSRKAIAIGIPFSALKMKDSLVVFLEPAQVDLDLLRSEQEVREVIVWHGLDEEVRASISDAAGDRFHLAFGSDGTENMLAPHWSWNRPKQAVAPDTKPDSSIRLVPKPTARNRRKAKTAKAKSRRRTSPKKRAVKPAPKPKPHRISTRDAQLIQWATPQARERLEQIGQSLPLMKRALTELAAEEAVLQRFLKTGRA